MGILNLTPDSFYDGGYFQSEKEIISRVEQMLNEGADIIDMGAVSTRPGAKAVSEKEELERLIPGINIILKNFHNIIISVDTFRSEVARKAIDMGAHIINDISGGTMDSNMFATISELGVPYILMHIQGTPETMQKCPIVSDVTEKVRDFFVKKVDELHKLGVESIILDPGFGFGKSLTSNY